MGTWVSIVDDNVVNQNALQFLVESMASCGSEPENFIVLAVQNDLPIDFRSWLAQKKVDMEYFNWSKTKDPYEIKFLLLEFINKHCGQHDDLLYLDPDHLLIQPLEMVSHDRKLIVSSEFCAEARHLATTHYNTSLVFGKTHAWLALQDTWRAEYNRLNAENFPLRYLEEIAFGHAAFLSGISVEPCSSETQSNYKIQARTFSLFHYGGEYTEAKEIKKCLATRRIKEVINNLRDVSLNTSSDLQRYIAQKMLALL